MGKLGAAATGGKFLLPYASRYIAIWRGSTFAGAFFLSRKPPPGGRAAPVLRAFCRSQLSAAEQSALERDWQPYLDGKTSFEQALRELVRDAR